MLDSKIRFNLILEKSKVSKKLIIPVNFIKNKGMEDSEHR